MTATEVVRRTVIDVPPSLRKCQYAGNSLWEDGVDACHADAIVRFATRIEIDGKYSAQNAWSCCARHVPPNQKTGFRQWQRAQLLEQAQELQQAANP